MVTNFRDPHIFVTKKSGARIFENPGTKKPRIEIRGMDDNESKSRINHCILYVLSIYV